MAGFLRFSFMEGSTTAEWLGEDGKVAGEKVPV